MKKILTMVLAMMFVAGPVMAAVPSPAEEGGPLTLESLEAAATSVVAEDAVLDDRPAGTPAAAQEDGTNTGKVILGIALIAGGAGFIANGASLWQSDEDLFGRKKNLDSYSLYALGGASAFVGALVLRSGLRGEGW